MTKMVKRERPTPEPSVSLKARHTMSTFRFSKTTSAVKVRMLSGPKSTARNLEVLKVKFATLQEATMTATSTMAATTTSR